MSTVAKSASSSTPISPPIPPAKASPLDDYVRTIIALAIGLGGLIFIISAWAFLTSSDAQTITTAMTGLMGGVLGYYFGAHGKTKSDAAADTATAKADAAKDAKAKVLGPVAEAMGKLKVISTPTGETRMRPAVAGQPATPVDEAIADLQKVIDQLS